MAEQKFLGQAGTDVLVEKVKKNAEDILLQIPKNTVMVYDWANDKTAISAQRQQVISWLQHGAPVLIKGLKLTERMNQYIIDSDSWSLISINDYMSTYPISKIYTLFEQGASIDCFPTQMYKLNDDKNKLIIDESGGTDTVVEGYPRKGKIFASDGILYVVTGACNVAQLNLNLTQQIEEITAQEVSDKFNS